MTFKLKLKTYLHFLLDYIKISKIYVNIIKDKTKNKKKTHHTNTIKIW